MLDGAASCTLYEGITTEFLIMLLPAMTFQKGIKISFINLNGLRRKSVENVIENLTILQLIQMLIVL